MLAMSLGLPAAMQSEADSLTQTVMALPFVSSVVSQATISAAIDQAVQTVYDSATSGATTAVKTYIIPALAVCGVLGLIGAVTGGVALSRQKRAARRASRDHGTFTERRTHPASSLNTNPRRA